MIKIIAMQAPKLAWLVRHTTVVFTL